MPNNFYGSSNRTPVGSTGKKVRTNPDVTKPKGREFRIRDEGKGPHVTDVTYDENLRTLSVRRAGHQTANIDSIRYGKVVSPSDSLGPINITEIQGPKKWFLSGPNPKQEESPTLLPDYKHGDPFPAAPILPAGMSYVRLQAGSLPVEGSAWDADVESYGSEDEAQKGSIVGVVAASVTDRGSASDYTKATINLWYSHKISPRVPGNYTIGSKALFQASSSKAPVKVVQVTKHSTLSNVLVLTLNRPVSLTETLRLRVKQASAYAFGTKHPAAESAELNVSLKMARNCYVLVVNRTDAPLSVGDSVVIGKPLTIYDAPENSSEKPTALSVYDVMVGGGSSASSPICIGTVMGGNSTSVRIPQAEPVGTSVLALPTPFFDSEGVLAPHALPDVADWANYPEVMEDYTAYGKALPVLPDGLCYIRLERPYSLRGKSWDSAYPPNPGNQTTAPPGLVTARVGQSSRNVVDVYFDTELEGPVGIIGLFHLLDKTSGSNVALQTATLTGSNKVSLAMASALDLTHSYTLSISAKAVRATQVGPPEHSRRYNNAAETSVVFEFMSSSLLIAINRVGSQTFYAGDLVIMQDSGLTITDSNPASGVATTRSVAEVLSNASNARSPHTHVIADFSNDGGMGSLP